MDTHYESFPKEKILSLKIDQCPLIKQHMKIVMVASIWKTNFDIFYDNLKGRVFVTFLHLSVKWEEHYDKYIWKSMSRTILSTIWIMMVASSVDN